MKPYFFLLLMALPAMAADVNVTIYGTCTVNSDCNPSCAPFSKCVCISDSCQEVHSLTGNDYRTDLPSTGTGFSLLAGNASPGLTQFLTALFIALGTGIVILSIASAFKRPLAI